MLNYVVQKKKKKKKKGGGGVKVDNDQETAHQKEIRLQNGLK